MVFGEVGLLEMQERFFWAGDGILQGKVWYYAVSAPGTIFWGIAAHLVPCCRHPFGRVQSYTPSLLPRQNATCATHYLQKLQLITIFTLEKAF